MTHKDDPIEYDENEGAEPGMDEDAADDNAAAKLKKVKEDLKRCEALQKEYLDGWQRTKADFANYRKDEGKRYGEMAQSVTEDLLRDIVLVLDSFEMARRYEMPKGVADGVFMIQAQLEDVLRKRGFEHIPVTIGDPLNPSKHESIGEVESDVDEGMIAEEVQKGYMFQNRVIRPARVKVSKGK